MLLKKNPFKISVFIGSAAILPLIKDKNGLLITLFIVLAVVEGVLTIICIYLCINDEAKPTRYLDVHYILNKKPKFQTIVEIYEKRFLVFNRKVDEVIEAFEFENYLNEACNLPEEFGYHQISKINFEVKFDDEETEEAYKEHLQRIERQLLQEYQINGRIIKIKFKRKITLDGKESPIFQYGNSLEGYHFCRKAFYFIKESILFVKLFLLLFDKTILSRLIPKRKQFNIVIRVSNKNLTVI